MWFSEPLEAGLSRARLLNSLGEEVPTGAARLDPSDSTHLTLPLGPLGPGIYTVAWQTLSQVDGHEWYASFPFSVLNPDGSRPGGVVAATGDGPRGELPSPGEIASRWLVLLGGALFFGTSLFHKVAVSASREKSSRNDPWLETRVRDLALRALGVAVLAIALGSWLQIVLQALRLGGPSLLPSLVLGTRTGALVLVRQLLTFVALLVAMVPSQSRPLGGRERPLFFLTGVYAAIVAILLVAVAARGERVLAVSALVIAALGMALAAWTPRNDAEVTERRTWQALLLLAAVLLLSISIGSHAGAVPGSVWAILGDYVHLVAASTWIGGLVLLPALVWHVRKAASMDHHQFFSLVRRFSYLASFAVFALAVTGLFNSLVELPDLSGLFNTPYGRVLLVKLFLIVLTLGVALFNNRLVHRQVRNLPGITGLSRFNRQVGLEAILSLGIMLIVAVLVQTPTPRSLAPATTAYQPELPFNAIVRADDLYAHVQVTPNRVGSNRFWIHLYHQDGSPIGEVQLVRLLFNYREAQLGQSQADLEPLGQNTFAVEGAYLSQAGGWDLTAYIRRRGMDDTLTEANLTVPPPTSESTSAKPWENPIPGLPAGVVVAGMLVAIGVIPFIWRRPLREAQAELFPTLRLIGGIIILAGLVASAVSIPALLALVNPAGKPVPTSPNSIAAGAELYQEHCANCHGINGRGDGPLALTLNPHPADLAQHTVPGVHSDGQLYDWITNGFPGSAMPAFKAVLSDDERWHLVNFIRTLARP
jgi:copper transport protein